jgi:hypothetical protein
MKIENTDVYNLEQSLKASKYPMSTDINALNSELTTTIIKLGNAAKGSGHDNFLNGIVVSFDLTCSNKMWVEMERYHFVDFVSSQSTMHRIAQFDIEQQVNSYVTENTIQEVKKLRETYLQTKDSEDYLRLLYNIPSGIELTARLVTNYRQLKTIHAQRRNHRLPEWREFCKWVETLPYAKELFLKEEENGN